jgi:zinc protease
MRYPRKVLDKLRSAISGSPLLAGAAAVVLVCPLSAVAQPAVGEHRTPGGLTFRYAHMPSAQYQTIRFAWRDNYVLGGKVPPGVWTLGPALVLQGPQGMSRGEFIEDLKDLDARIRLTSGPRGMMGFLHTTPEHIDGAVSLLARTLARPALDERRLRRISRRLQLSANRQEAKAYNQAHRAKTYLLFPEGPVRRWLLGYKSNYSKVSIGHVRQWQSAVFNRRNLLIAAAGSASPATVAKQIDKLFAHLPQGDSPEPATEIPRRNPGRVLAFVSDVPQTVLVMTGWSGFDHTSDRAAGRLANSILQLRLYKAIREELGAAYGVSATFFRPVSDPYILILSTAVAHDQAPAALKILRDTFKDFMQRGVTTAELAAEKSKLIDRLRQRYQKAAGVSAAMLGAMLDGLPADTVETAPARVAALTVEQVNEAITKKLRGRNYATIIVAPSAGRFAADCIIRKTREARGCR